MVYQQIFDQASREKVVHVGVIGSGHFSTAVIAQAAFVPQLEVRVVADVNVEAARRAYRRAGIPDEHVALCDTHRAALRAFEMGKHVIVEDATLLMVLPIDIVAEATGIPEAGARHARQALEHGKHVAMITKEADATVGPLLTHLARQAGLIYTPVDGDQHGLLIQLVSWARQLGLEVLCGGKARDAEFVYDRSQGIVSCGERVIRLAEEVRWILDPIAAGKVAAHVRARRHHLAGLPRLGGFDLTELVIAANSTGLMPDVASSHHPALHTREIPEVFSPHSEGGILQSSGVIDTVTCLRQAHEAGLGGGVFITVACDNAYARMILATKGLIPNEKHSSMLIYRPYHLCGVETPVSLLCAALANMTTGSLDVMPRADIMARAKRDLKAGEVIGDDHSPGLEFFVVPALKVQADTELPFHLANRNRLTKDVSAGTALTRDMIQAPAESVLWSLRAQQDRQFLE